MVRKELKSLARVPRSGTAVRKALNSPSLLVKFHPISSYLTVLEKPPEEGVVRLKSPNRHGLGPMEVTRISNVVGSHADYHTQCKVRQMSH